MAGEPETTRRASSVRSPFAGPVRSYTLAAAFLTALVAFAVPIAAVSTDVPVGTLFVGGVVVYLLVTAATGVLFEGLAAALFVTAAFNVAAPVTTVPWVLDLWVRYVDVLAVVVSVPLLAYAWRERSLPLDRYGLVVVGGFAAFVAWSFLSSAVGNGPADRDAFLYAVDQLRLLALLVASVLLVGRTDARRVVYPLTVGLGGALAFAVDEVFAGPQRGVSRARRLGSVGVELREAWPSPSLTSFPLDATEVYDGVPVGQSRLMVGMALVFLALVLAMAMRSRRHALLSIAGLLGLAVVVAGGSDAGMLALYVLSAVLLVSLLHRALGRYGAYRARRLLLPAAGVVGVVGVAWLVAAVAAGDEVVLLLRTDTLAVRLVQYELAVELAARYPLFGIGGEGNYRAITGLWIHNLFLANLAATGVPGFVAYVTSVATATWLAVRRLVSRPTTERWLWVGVIGAMAAFYVYTFWVIAHRWESVNAMYWILVGVAVGTRGGSE